MVTEIENATQEELFDEISKKVNELYELIKNINNESKYRTTLVLDFALIERTGEEAHFMRGDSTFGELFNIGLSVQRNKNFNNIAKAYIATHIAKAEMEAEK